MTITPSEGVIRMRAYALAHRFDPVVPREATSSAFDHPTVAPGGTITAGSDRVKLCDPVKLCRMCRERMRVRGY